MRSDSRKETGGRLFRLRLNNNQATARKTSFKKNQGGRGCTRGSSGTSKQNGGVYAPSTGTSKQNGGVYAPSTGRGGKISSNVMDRSGVFMLNSHDCGRVQTGHALKCDVRSHESIPHSKCRALGSILSTSGNGLGNELPSRGSGCGAKSKRGSQLCYQYCMTKTEAEKKKIREYRIGETLSLYDAFEKSFYLSHPVQYKRPCAQFLNLINLREEYLAQQNWLESVEKDLYYNRKSWDEQCINVIRRRKVVKQCAKTLENALVDFQKKLSIEEKILMDEIEEAELLHLFGD